MFKIPVSNGEIIDKYTILGIKLTKINDKKKLINIKLEYNMLEEYIDKLKCSELGDLINKLKIINMKLWNIEDKIRKKEKKKEFDNEFIRIARKVYLNNDERFRIKSLINLKTNSIIKEEKSY